MLTNPSSLVARVFTARYCKQGDLLTAEVRSNASFVWRSLAWSRGVIEKGMLWKVGDGRNISVFDDKWVAGIEGSIRNFGEEVSGEGLKVGDLLGPDGRWDVERVEEMFSPMVQLGILNTPIGESGGSDERRWRFDEKGLFSVKSAYLAEIGYYEQDPHVSSPDRKRWSRLVWNVSIPPKARIFLWRAFNNDIPTEANLRIHHVPTSGICGLCGDRWGSSEHCLLYCPRVRWIWKDSRFGEVIKKADGMELVEVAETVRKERGEADYDLWCMLTWQVWVYVCKLLHPEDGGAEPASEEMCFALWEAYQSARPTYEQTWKLGLVLGDNRWKRPKRGRLRVDVDAHFDREGQAFGVGVVVRDESGKMRAALAKKTGPSSSPMMAEIMAVIQGIVLCVEHDFAPVEIFTDSFLAARLMADPEEAEQLLPEDICEIMQRAREFLLIGVFHMYRTANEVAHSLALFAASSLQSCCWTDCFPSWLRNLVSEDIQ